MILPSLTARPVYNHGVKPGTTIFMGYAANNNINFGGNGISVTTDAFASVCAGITTRGRVLRQPLLTPAPPHVLLPLSRPGHFPTTLSA